MATIRKRDTSWQVQVRRAGYPHCTRTFRLKADAEHWGRLVEAEIDRGDLPVGRQALRGRSLADLFCLYRDKVTPTKRGALQERYRLEQFLAHDVSGVPHINITYWKIGGAVAQMGERRVRNAKVRSSILLGSTNFPICYVDMRHDPDWRVCSFCVIASGAPGAGAGGAHWRS